MMLLREKIVFQYEAIACRFANSAPVLVTGQVSVQCQDNLLWAIQADCMNHHENVDWESLSVSEVLCGD